ncbi:unnamed protein product [Didymodactylos carnosus]|uniref:Uncharacterized protein n=1 Tax=Didymodactylos carnosus TaxID=1234261 RepID=A0A8S2HS77_9BILA|nr:unnamed protein product [Didymodactylos carnosus]CAF3677196.1 unnamed protein product [Didymodactylos carnosus]
MGLVRKRHGGGRHKKLKAIDPFYSGPRKLLIDKKLFNANIAPKKHDKNDSKVSNRFREFLSNKEYAIEKSKKQQEILDNKRFLHKNKADENRAEKFLPLSKNLEQRPNEPFKKYMQRVEQEAKYAIDRAQYETKYDVKLIDGENHIEIEKEKSKRTIKRLKRLQEKKQDLKLKKEEKKIKQDDFQFFQDKPEFGEVVHGPPTLNMPKRNKVSILKGGAKDLLLKKKLKNKE